MSWMKALSAAAAALIGFGFATTAQAVSSIDLIWRTNGTSTIDTAVDGLGPHVLDVVLNADSVGIVALSIGFRFDADLANELNFVSGGEFAMVKLPGMGNAFTPLLPGLQKVTESTASTAGLLEQFDQSAGLSTGAISTTVTLGSITFTVNNGITDGVDIQSGFFTFGIDGATASTGLVPLTQGTASVVPEPTTAVLIVFGLVGLGLAGRRSAR